MSDIPGYTLESWVAWDHNITVHDRPDSNFSIAVAELLGAVQHRPTLTEIEFSQIVCLYESLREQIEDRLSDFDDGDAGWRTYAGSAFDFIPTDTFSQAQQLIQCIIRARPEPS